MYRAPSTPTKPNSSQNVKTSASYASPERTVKSHARSQVFTSPAKHAAATNLPKEEFINQLASIQDVKLAKDLDNLVKNLYSYLTQRPYQEGIQSFSTTTAGTVAYEVLAGFNIKGKNHAVKAANQYNRCIKMISRLKDGLSSTSPSLSYEQWDIYDGALGFIKLQADTIITALKSIEPSEKQAILNNHNLDIDKTLLMVTNEAEKQLLLQNLYTDSPMKNKDTPLRLTPRMKNSLSALKTPVHTRSRSYGSSTPSTPSIISLTPCSSTASQSPLTPSYSNWLSTPSSSSSGRTPPNYYQRNHSGSKRKYSNGYLRSSLGNTNPQTPIVVVKKRKKS